MIAAMTEGSFTRLSIVESTKGPEKEDAPEISARQEGERRILAVLRKWPSVTSRPGFENIFSQWFTRRFLRENTERIQGKKQAGESESDARVTEAQSREMTVYA